MAKLERRPAEWLGCCLQTLASGRSFKCMTTTLPQRREVTGAVHKGENKNVLSSDLVVYESITPDEKFSNVWDTAFWYHTATLGKGSQQPGRCPCFSNVTSAENPESA